MCFFAPTVRSFIQVNCGTNIQNLLIKESKLLIMMHLGSYIMFLGTLVHVNFKYKTMLSLLMQFYVKVLLLFASVA